MSAAQNIKLNSFDSLFGEESNGMTEVNISALTEFANHPYKVLDDEKMADMAESIKEYGVLSPIIVRKADSGYEIISGHRRVYACKKIGLTKIPAVIKDLTDDEAIILMVDSNIQREEILPSEKAFSYKMKLDALKRQGKRNDLTSDLTSAQIGQKLSVEKLAEEAGESKNQIQRYIRLTNLLEDFLVLVDDKKIPLNAAVDISFLSENEQLELYLIMDEQNIIPSLKQSARLKEYSQKGELNKTAIEIILSEEKPTVRKVNLKEKTLSNYFPPEYTAEQMEDVIIALLEKWAKK